MAAHIVALSRIVTLSAALALSGCKITTPGLRTTHTASATAAASSGTPGAASTTRATSEPAGAANATTAEHNPMYDEKGFVIRRDDPPGTQYQPAPRSIDRRDLATLLGLTADQARQRLKEIGHTGPVRVVAQAEEIRKYPPNTVCMMYPHGGMMEYQEITLYLNGTFKIAAPPP